MNTRWWLVSSDRQRPRSVRSCWIRSRLVSRRTSPSPTPGRRGRRARRAALGRTSDRSSAVGGGDRRWIGGRRSPVGGAGQPGPVERRQQRGPQLVDRVDLVAVKARGRRPPRTCAQLAWRARSSGGALTVPARASASTSRVEQRARRLRRPACRRRSTWSDVRAVTASTGRPLRRTKRPTSSSLRLQPPPSETRPSASSIGADDRVGLVHDDVAVRSAAPSARRGSPSARRRTRPRSSSADPPSWAADVPCRLAERRPAAGDG